MSRAVIQCEWNDVPHLSDEAKKDLYDSVVRLHPHQAEARTKGVPSLGAGVIYPFDEASIKVDPFKIPKHWKRAFGLDADAGSGWTAIVWGAVDLDTNTCYIYDCYKSGSRELSLHVDALRQRGLQSAKELLIETRQPVDASKSYEFWIPGVGDAKTLIVTEYDSHQVIELYRAAGVDIEYPDKAVEAGLSEVFEGFVTQRLKVWSTCTAFWQERRLYRRNERGAIIKKDDHVMDACLGPDTEVLTGDGPRPIASLVGTTGIVLSRDGVWARYVGARKTLENVPVVRVEFEDGSSVRCTPDHPFLTPNGWRRADEMAGSICYDAVSQRIQRWPLWLRSLPQRARHFKASVIGSVEGISLGQPIPAGNTSIDGSGKRLMGGQCRLDTTSIIGTRTAAITSLATWKLNRRLNIFQTIARAWRSRSRRMPPQQRHGGIEAIQVVRGIGSTMCALVADYIRALVGRALTAAETTKPATKAEIGSVQTAVRLNRAWRLVLTMRNVIAWSAARSLSRIGIWQSAPALGAARNVLRIVHVEPCATSDVYCLTVPGLSAFALANGAVVHNTRYLIRSGLKRAKMFVEAAPKKAPSLVYDVGQQGTGWMA